MEHPTWHRLQAQTDIAQILRGRLDLASPSRNTLRRRAGRWAVREGVGHSLSSVLAMFGRYDVPELVRLSVLGTIDNG